MIATITLPLIPPLSTLLPCSNNSQRAELDDRGGDRREVGQIGEIAKDLRHQRVLERFNPFPFVYPSLYSLL